uniref:Homeobox protein n=1 Tax=Takifugu rubripes TaxID=31033 RepID=A0A674N0I4_TAKRU
MSTSGTLTSYYVDSLILPENEELSVPRYSAGPGHQHSRQPASIGDPHSELGTCSFPSKPPVFGPSWSHVPAQFPGTVSSVYHHHYGHHQGPVGTETDGRYQSWLLEPMSGSLPMAGLPTTHHYGIKPDGLGVRSGGALPGSHTALLLSDYANGTVATAPPVEKDAVSSHTGDGVDTEEKPGLDPNNPVSNWLHASATRKKRCPYTKHQILELEKEFLFNTYLTRDRSCCQSQPGPHNLATGQKNPHLPLNESIRCKAGDFRPTPGTRPEKQLKMWFPNRRMKREKDKTQPVCRKKGRRYQVHRAGRCRETGGVEFRQLQKKEIKT